MLKLDVQLEVLTLEELVAARETLQHDIVEVEMHDPQHRHPELLQLFAALEHAVEEIAAERGEERHRIAEALAIDETSGEWLAGA